MSARVEVPPQQRMLDLLLQWWHNQPPPEEERDETRSESELDEVAEPTDVLIQPAPDHHTIGIQSIGAWAGYGSIGSDKTIRRDVNFMLSSGIRRVDIILNDHSKWRMPTEFNTYDLKGIRKFALACNAADIAVHFMTWMMPHREYIERAASVIKPLMKDCAAVSTVLDCEEPWTKAAHPLPWADAAKRVRESFKDVRLGCTAIGYCSQLKLKALMKLVDYWVPQCYSTGRSGLDPATVVALFMKVWRMKFGVGKPFVPGLAAYRQTGFKSKISADTAMRLAFSGAEAQGDVKEVVYWSLKAIRSSSTITKAVASLAKKGQVA